MPSGSSLARAVTLVVAVAAGTMAGCSGAPTSQVSTVSLPTAPLSRQVPPGTRAPTADERVARCEAALERSASLDAGEAAGVIATGCADLYSRAACRDAHREAPAERIERRAASIATACADAYCPTLAAPQPALCARRSTLPPPTELLPLWVELNERILHEDLGPERAARILDRRRANGSARNVASDDTPECHHACCGPNQQGPDPDGRYECCLCDGP